MENRKKQILSLLCSFMLVLSTAFPVIAAENPEKIAGSTAGVLSDVPLADSEELLNGYVSRLLEPPGAKISLLGNWGEEGDALNEDEKIIYQSLKSQVAETAANGGSTEFLISDFSFTWTLDGYPNTSEIEKQGKELFVQKVDLRKVLEYLMINCPYELYWFDKTQGFQYTSSIGKNTPKQHNSQIFALPFRLPKATGTAPPHRWTLQKHKLRRRLSLPRRILSQSMPGNPTMKSSRGTKRKSVP